MKALKGQKNLYLMGNIYYFRKAIPEILVPYFGRKEYKKSLHNRNFREACRAAWALNIQVEWFFEAVKDMAKRLTADVIKELVQGHFEKCLLDAESDYFLEKHLMPAEGDFDPRILRNMAQKSAARLQLLQNQRQSHEHSPSQLRTARNLIEQSGADSGEQDSAFYELCNGLVRAQHEAERINHAFLTGNEQEGTIKDLYFADCKNYFQTPDPGAIDHFRHLDYVPRENAAPRRAILLSEALENYFRYKQSEEGLRDKDAQTQMEKRTSKIALFFPGTKPLETFTDEDGYVLREKLLSLPNNTHHLTDEQTLATMASDKPYKRISAATFTAYWQSFQTFFKYCRRRRWLYENPLEDIRPNIRKAEGKKRRNFSGAELKRLFSSPLFAGHRNAQRARWEAGDIKTKDGQFWVPLVGLFQGMRMGEILGLMKEDIKVENGIWCFHVRKNGRRRVKNFNSERLLPIHDALIKMGLLKYLEKRMAQLPRDTDLIFEDGITIPAKQKIIKNYSRNFGDYLDALEMTDPQLVFHSFRHNFCTAMATCADIPPHVMDMLDGRSAGTDMKSSSRTGYLHFDVPILKTAIDKVMFDVDLSHLYD